MTTNKMREIPKLGTVSALIRSGRKEPKGEETMKKMMTGIFAAALAMAMMAEGTPATTKTTVKQQEKPKTEQTQTTNTQKSHKKHSASKKTTTGAVQKKTQTKAPATGSSTK